MKSKNRKKELKGDAPSEYDHELELNRLLIRKQLSKPMNKRMNFLRVRKGNGSHL